jgi:hypothetical protein
VAGRSDFGDLGVAIPPDFQSYLDLGRFRRALVTTESRRRPSDGLSAFMRGYQLPIPKPDAAQSHAAPLAQE